MKNKPDRIFLNVETGATILSGADGMMREDAPWTQIGTVNLSKYFPLLSALALKKFRGRVKFS